MLISYAHSRAPYRTYPASQSSVHRSVDCLQTAFPTVFASNITIKESTFIRIPTTKVTMKAVMCRIPSPTQHSFLSAKSQPTHTSRIDDLLNRQYSVHHDGISTRELISALRREQSREDTGSGVEKLDPERERTDLVNEAQLNRFAAGRIALHRAVAQCEDNTNIDILKNTAGAPSLPSHLTGRCVSV